MYDSRVSVYSTEKNKEKKEEKKRVLILYCNQKLSTNLNE